MREVIERYIVREGDFDILVKITGGKGKIPKYEVQGHDIQEGTSALIDQIKTELISAVQVTPEEIRDPKVAKEIKNRFSTMSANLLDEKLPESSKEIKKYLLSVILREMLGLGDIEILLNDIHLEEIVVMSANEPIRVYHKKLGWLATNLFIKKENKIADHINTIARKVGRQISSLSPLLDAHLVTGDRANAVLFPISSKGNTITIRKFARDPWTVTDFLKNGTISFDTIALIWFVIQYEGNVIVSGGTGSGKTSILNILMPMIPPNHRIVSIEDTRELSLPDYLYWCPLTTRQKNPEGKGEVTMLDLLINSLRMRPDRIVLGEMRKKEQAEVLFEAMHTGHSVYATVHADSSAATIQRLTNPPLDVPSSQLSTVNLNIVMFRDRRKNIRRIIELSEYIVHEESDKIKIKPNVLYKWKPKNDTIAKLNKPIRLYYEMGKLTGLSKNDIDKDIDKKKQILQWLVKNNIRDINTIGKIMNMYYLDQEDFYKKMKKIPVDKIISESID